MATHILRGDGAPASIPEHLGQHYIDITNGVLYESNGTTLTTDWVKKGPLDINDLSDVDTETAAPTEGQVLTFQSDTWVPADPSGGGGGGGGSSNFHGAYLVIGAASATGGVQVDAPVLQAPTDPSGFNVGGQIVVPAGVTLVRMSGGFQNTLADFSLGPAKWELLLDGSTVTLLATGPVATTSATWEAAFAPLAVTPGQVISFKVTPEDDVIQAACGLFIDVLAGSILST